MLNINEIGNVHDRVAEMVDVFCKGNKAAFGRGADIQSGVLAGIISGRKNKPSFDLIQKLLAGYPSVNPKWLIFGHGSMLSERPELLDMQNLPVPEVEARKILREYVLEYIQSDEFMKLVGVAPHHQPLKAEG